MTSKEALNKIWDFIETHYTEKDDYPKNLYDILEGIEQDLDKLEKLEEENEALKMGIESLHTDYKELKQTNEFVIEKVIEILKDCLDIKL